MLPVSLLMTEHRLIERMIKQMDIQLQKTTRENKADINFIDRKILEELLSDHNFGRRTVSNLATAKERYAGGDNTAINEIIKSIKELVEFYPKHIEKEDKRFFLQSMEYFSRQEQDDMLNEFKEYDRNFIHGIYRNVVEKLEAAG